MSDIQLRTADQGTLDVSSGMLRVGIRGNWIGTLTIGWTAQPAIGGAAALIFTREDGTADTFTGTIRWSAQVPNTEDIAVTIVGGKGRLLDPQIPARHHTAGTSTVPAGLVVASIVQAAGETLAVGVEAALDALPLPRWTRTKSDATDALDVFSGVLARGWRVLDTGEVWAGAETWPAVVASDVGAQYVSGRAADGMVLYATDGAPLRPGTAIDGAQAREVCYYFNAMDALPVNRWLRAEVRVAIPGDPVYGAPIDAYRASWPGSVRAQDGDGGVLQIVCDSDVIGNDLRDIAARVDWPGCKLTIPENTRVSVRFDGADPRGAYAVSIDQDPSASKAFALKDDKSVCGTLSAMVTVTALSTPTAVLFTYAGPFSSAAAAASVDLTGKIDSPCHAYAKGVPAS